MAIDFSMDRWQEIRETAKEWWTGKLDRPLIQMRLTGADPGRPEPKLRQEHFTAFYDFDVSAEAIVDRWDYDLSCERYLGDGFPHVWSNFGPGVVATFLGGKMETGSNTCWFHPKQEKEMRDLKLESDGDTVWLDRINSTYTAAMERWQGLVQVGITDLGGNLDILSTFRPGEKLLMDLLDCPDAVKRVTWQAHKQWWFYFEKMNSLLQPVNPGYTCWTSIYSEIPYYMLQCDFCYMISPEMFDEFVKPELAASCKKLGNAFYHLDGPGQLAHLDSLLEIPELKGVQWVPGAGQPDYDHWADVYRKILDAGKLFQIWGDWEIYEKLVAKLGTARGICFITGESYSKKTEAIEFLKKWRVI